MPRAIHITSVERGIGKAWRHWLAFLENIDARGLPQGDRPARARGIRHQRLVAQSIAVAYEQDVGRGVPGQQCDGSFRCQSLRPSPAPWTRFWHAGRQRWQAATQFAGIAITRGPTVSWTDKWRYWRPLADGSRVSVGIGNKDSRKATLGVSQDRLDSPRAVERCRASWKAELAAL